MLVEANLHPFAILPPVMSTLIKNLYCLKPGQLPIFLVTDVQVLGGSCFSNVRSEAGMSLHKTCEVRLKPGQLPIFLVTDVQVLGGSCFSNVRSEAGMSLHKTCEVCLKPGQLPIFLVTDVQVLGGSCFSNVRSEAGMSLHKTCEVCKTFCRILLKRGILLHTYSCL